jgi:GT2 family glycosyltransferase
LIDLSVIIVSYNTRELLMNCLRSIRDCSKEAAIEILVVDNNSGDGSADSVERDFQEVRLIRNRENTGFAAANNQALHEATGRYLMLLNSDTLVHAGAFRELIAFMDAHRQAGYCGPKLLNDDGTHQPSAKRFPTLWSRSFSMVGLAQRYPESRHCLDLHISKGSDAPFQTDWVTGACLVVRREAFEAVGLMDEGYFLYFEETDWCRKMVSAGHAGWYVPAAKVTHLGGRSVEHSNDVRPFFGNHPVHWVRSARRYQRRHFGYVGMVVAQWLEMLLYVLIWLRHVWRPNEKSRAKARTAGAAVRCMLTH